MRLVDPESAIEYYEMWPVCDDGDKRPFVVENMHQGKGVLSEVLGDRDTFYRGGILDSRLDEFKQKYWHYEKEDPELLLQVAFNNDKSGNNGDWKPTRKIAFNSIDREPESEGNFTGQNWCVMNKHLKMLKMGKQAFISLMDTRDNNGDLVNYDLNYKKTGKGKKGTIHNIQKAGDQLAHVVVGPITKEEKSFEIYDLKTECALSQARYILKYLTKTLARIDKVLGTNYLQQLQEQAKLEGPAEGEDNYTPPDPNAPQASNPQQPETPPVQQPETPPVQQPEIPPVRTRAPEAPPVATNQIPCPFCKEMIADSSEVCSKCSRKLMEPCDNPDCKKPFSVTASVCPHCGKKYKLG